MARIVKAPEERREEIIQTAKKLFLELGYAKTQINDITKELGIAHGLVYHYFKSKSEILDAVIAVWADEYLAHIHDAIGDSTINAMERFTRVFDYAEKSVYANLPLAKEMNDGNRHAEIQRRINQKRSEVVVPLFTRFIMEGNKDGSFNCPHPYEAAVFCAYGGAAIPIQGSIEEHIGKIKVLYMRILGCKHKD